MKFSKFTHNRLNDTAAPPAFAIPRVSNQAIATPQTTFGGEFLHRTIPGGRLPISICARITPSLMATSVLAQNAAITFLLMNDWEPTFDESELLDSVLACRFG
jgi:hypothetical protein